MANNKYVNKVIFGDETLIDLTSDTVTADKLLQGYTAHNSAGQQITGTIQNKAPTPSFNNGHLEIIFDYGLYSGTMNLSTITVPVPSSGTNTITIKLPNGITNPSTSNEGDWIPITFTVDTQGNSEVTADTITATKLTAGLISGDDYVLMSEV